jgi:hypothetical protein
VKKTLFLTTLAVLVLASALPSTAYAGPGTGDCVKAVKAFIDAGFDSPFDTDSNHGDAISDGFFGNEPNLLNTNTNDDLGPNEVEPGSSAGEVVGSGSPGPKLIGGGFLTWGSIYRGVVRDNCAQ